MQDCNNKPAGLVRHRRRMRYGVPAAVLAAGLSVAGVTAAVATSDGEEPATDAAVAAGQRDRVTAAERADRGQRPASPSPSAASASPSAKATTASPVPKAAAPRTAAPKAKPKAKPKTTKKAAPAWVSPLPGSQITSCYGMRWGVLHAGIDFAAPAGTPIRAVGAGTVASAGWSYAGYGISVVVDHGNGYLTHYAHQSRLAVKVGQRVSAGQVIGYEGSTGDSTGPHLHFEVHRGGLWQQVDPTPWLRAHGIATSC